MKPGITTAVSLLAAGCAVAESRDAAVVRDSAGIRIVESNAPAWGDVAWQVSDSPVVRIGAVGDESSQLFRVSDVTQLANGSIVVANQGTDEVRVFDGSGGHVRTIGRSGRGPGEFTGVRRVYAIGGDSLLVVDLARVSLFAPEGEFVRSTQEVSPPPDAAVRLSNGAFIGLRFAPGQNPMVLGTSRPRYSLVRWSPWDPDSAVIAEVDGDAVFRKQPEGSGSVYSWRQPFGPRLAMATHGDRLFLGDGVQFEIRVLDSIGAPMAIYRRDVAPISVTEDALRTYERSRLDEQRTEGFRLLLESVFREWTAPETQPYFDTFVVDSEGNLWVRAYSRDQTVRPMWSVFDTDGKWLGDVATPRRLDVRAIGPDYVLGLWQDANDVEYVQKHPLVKPR